MPNQSTRLQEAGTRTTEDLISRIMSGNRICFRQACATCVAERTILTARISTPERLANNNIGRDQQLQAQAALDGATHDGSTTTTSESNDARSPIRSEAVGQDTSETVGQTNVPVAPGSDPAAAAEIFRTAAISYETRRTTGEELSNQNGGWWISRDGRRIFIPEGDIVPGGWTREQEEVELDITAWVSNSRAERNAATVRAVEMDDAPVEPALAGLCDCDACSAIAAEAPRGRDNVPSSPRRDDRRTAAASRLP